ncbi:MAG TPA: adenylate/guanylate cyclase domain-containing protein [Candidatus Limnocylindrales bacterium]|nr:adenylate/guanylate cyclase domain-containing protein [Candidatus Limnocylindrales bacterium]
MAAEPIAPPVDPERLEFWRKLLMGEDDGGFRRLRNVLRHVPSTPRCKQCNAPFGGVGAPVMRLMGRTPWDKNPHYCSSCFTLLQREFGGAEIPLSMLFADVRGSTGMAERIGPQAFTTLLNRFYREATRIVIEADGLVDKLVGDEIVALFAPGWAGQEHVRRAMEAGAAILRATGHDDAGEPWLPVGVGVHTGVAYVGTVGLGGMFTDFTALGDPVNATSRLAETARAGELLVSADALAAGQIAPGDLEAQDLELRGRVELLTAYRLDAGATEALLRRSPGATGVRSA